jgi:hypothetical protein
MQMGMAAFLSGAATATLQGDDLLREQGPRLFAASEFAASLLSGARPVTDPLLCSGRAGGVVGGPAPTFELAHALFARLGLDDAQTRRQLANVRQKFLASGESGGAMRCEIALDRVRAASHRPAGPATHPLGELYICGPWETITFGLPLP